MWTCKHCENQFDFVLTAAKANHSRWCDKNPKIDSYRANENIKLRINEAFDSKLGPIKDFKVSCHKCNITFEVKERESKFPSKSKYYCSRICANSHIVTDQHRKKTSTSRSGKPYQDPVTVSIPCKECSQSFTYIKKYTDTKPRRFCTKQCSSIYTNRNRNQTARNTRSAFRNYRLDCAFNFSLKDFPNEFDFSLIEKHGWYLPANRGNNLNGISRDHMVSVRFGFDNNVPAEHIRHPANCKLMQHNQNVSKGPSASITYEQLLDRIREWDAKYPNIPTKIPKNSALIGCRSPV